MKNKNSLYKNEIVDTIITDRDSKGNVVAYRFEPSAAVIHCLFNGTWRFTFHSMGIERGLLGHRDEISEKEAIERALGMLVAAQEKQFKAYQSLKECLVENLLKGITDEK